MALKNSLEYQSVADNYEKVCLGRKDSWVLVPSLGLPGDTSSNEAKLITSYDYCKHYCGGSDILTEKCRTSFCKSQDNNVQYINLQKKIAQAKFQYKICNWL
jgi:hypothetical protein